jgi:hypothetical protein
MVNQYQLSLTKQGMDVIVAGLAELPYKLAKPVLDECMRQFIAQEAADEQAAIAATQAPPAEDKEAE